MQHHGGHSLDPVPWSFPWYAPWRAVGQQVAEAISEGATPWDALNSVAPAPVRFVPHAELPQGISYEQYISETGTCPTRPGAHDFFNGLCWINFPQTKRKLNQLQATQIASDGVRPVRGAVRDALTVFDENAAFLYAPQVLWDALAAKRWELLCVHLRPLWQEARLVLFGHALLEKLQTPRKPVTAHVYRVLAQTDSIGAMDAWVAADLSSGKLAAKPFVHLPVLGVPGWWPANEDPEFYRDATVFRPLKSAVRQ